MSDVQVTQEDREAASQFWADTACLYGTQDKLLAEAFARHRLATRPAPVGEPFQADVRNWVVECFGEALADDKAERNRRVMEEVAELMQASGATASEFHQTIDWVFSKPAGEVRTELGDAMNTLAALASAHGLDLMAEARATMQRCWANIEKTRAKHALKPTFLTRPALDVDGLVEALRQCGEQFAFYAREHTAAGKLEKAATNQRFADLALAAIKDATDAGA